MSELIIPRDSDRKNTAILTGLTVLASLLVMGIVSSFATFEGSVRTLLLTLFGAHAAIGAVVVYGVVRHHLWAWLFGLVWFGAAIITQFWLLTFSNGLISGAPLGSTNFILAITVVVFGYMYEMRKFYLQRLTGTQRQVFGRAVVVGTLVWSLCSLYVTGLVFDADWHRFVDLTITGIGLGSLYALGTIGFVLIYKITGILNFAQGILVVLGAYSVVLFLQLGLLISVALVAVLVLAVVLGLLLERSIFKHFIGEPPLSVILVTLALISIIEGVLQMIIGGRRFRGYPSELDLATVTLPLEFSIRGSFLLGVVLALLMLLLLLAFFRYTIMGSVLQASASDEIAAMVLGISITQAIKIAWIVSLVLTMLSGVLLGISQGGANFGLENVLILIFAAAIFGGLDSLLGAFVGSVTVGVLEIYGSFYYAPIYGSGFELILPMLFLLAVIIIKPFGIWGTERIERL